MNVGIVCEGRTDFILLEQVVLAVFGPSDIRPLQPVRDALDPTRWSEAGWTQVRRWCEARGAGGITDELEMGGLDVIVLQVDGDLRGQQGMPSTRAALRDHIKAAWIGPPSPPQRRRHLHPGAGDRRVVGRRARSRRRRADPGEGPTSRGSADRVGPQQAPV